MKLRLFNVFFCLLACTALVACETIDAKRKVDYKATRTLPPLDVPPDLASLPDANLPAGAQSRATFSEYAADRKAAPSSAADSALLPKVSNARIERDGQVRWLVVQASPERVWPRAREFVSSIGLIIDRENPLTGVIETDWAENRAKVGSSGQMLFTKLFGMLYSTGTRDKFRIRLEHGSQPATTEIYLTHRGMEEVVVPGSTSSESSSTRWQPRASDPDIEAELLRLMLVYLGKSEEQARKIVAETPAPPADRARLTQRGEDYSLSLQDSLDRAWRRVGLSLDRIGFTVEDRDRSKGIYYVRYIDPEEKANEPGFFSRLFGAGKKEESASARYQIHLQGTDAGTSVIVRTHDGAPEFGKTGERILSLLYEQLK